jgi:hypothetical protein
METRSCLSLELTLHHSDFHQIATPQDLPHPPQRTLHILLERITDQDPLGFTGLHVEPFRGEIPRRRLELRVVWRREGGEEDVVHHVVAHSTCERPFRVQGRYRHGATKDIVVSGDSDDNGYGLTARRNGDLPTPMNAKVSARDA